MARAIGVDRLGRNVINALWHTSGAFNLLWGALKGMRSLGIAPVRMVLYKQIYFTGIEALAKIAIIAALIGIVIITQVSNIVGMNAVLTGRILVWIVVRELGPLLTAIIVIARSCTAIASELGSMKANAEIRSICRMGISPLKYLIVPRVVGITVCVFILTFYFQVVAIFGGLALTSLLVNVPFFQQLSGIFSALGLYETVVSLVKSLVFGLVISATSCYHGLRVRSSITEIPQVTTAAVMQSLFIVFILDGLITVVSFI